MSSDKGMSAFFTLGILTNTEIIRDKQCGFIMYAELYIIKCPSLSIYLRSVLGWPDGSVG